MIDISKIDKAKALKWLVFSAIAIVIVLVLIYGIKTLRRWFGLSKEEEEREVTIHIAGSEELIRHGYDKRIEDYLNRLNREFKTDYWWIDSDKANRCKLYQSILNDLTSDEIQVLKAAYEDYYNQRLVDKVRNVNAWCPLLSPDWRAKFITELEK